MKKFLILLLIVFGVQSLINAQVPSTAQTKIVYNFTKQKYEVFAKFDVTVNPLLIGVSKVSVILPSSTQDLQLQRLFTRILTWCSMLNNLRSTENHVQSTIRVDVEISVLLDVLH